MISTKEIDALMASTGRFLPTYTFSNGEPVVETPGIGLEAVSEAILSIIPRLEEEIEHMSIDDSVAHVQRHMNELIAALEEAGRIHEGDLEVQVGHVEGDIKFYLCHPLSEAIVNALPTETAGPAVRDFRCGQIGAKSRLERLLIDASHSVMPGRQARAWVQPGEANGVVPVMMAVGGSVFFLRLMQRGGQLSVTTDFRSMEK